MTREEVTIQALQDALIASKKQAAYEHNRWQKLHHSFLLMRNRFHAAQAPKPSMLMLFRVRKFHQKFGLPAPSEHTLLDLSARRRRYNLITEEAKELLEATDPTSQLDALIDLLYVVHGTAVEMGLNPEALEEAFKVVHLSNLAKLGKDGKPILREDGKLLKPEGWQPPNLEGIFNPNPSQQVAGDQAHED